MRLGPKRLTLLAALGVLLAAPALAPAAFPGSNPSESPRLNTPNDPEFDRCEADDEDGTPDCASYFNEQFGSFGFSPDSSGPLAVYHDMAQLDAQGREANRDAGDPENKQLSGVRVDTAWKYSIGRPDVAVAILDTGIRWQDTELVQKVRLNTDELPKPEGSDKYDKNGDGRVSVSDYTGDSRIAAKGGDAAGDTESDHMLDASDLIAAFSDGTDDDSNHYVDDIAGWDFFDDDNDPFDASSCCNAEGHGTGRAREAAAETNNGSGRTGMCPRCQIMPLRVWDTFVVDTNNFALATVYAADNGASVVEGAVGGLSNSNFARRAFRYADAKGVTLTLVSSDINSANHNYPTNYNEAIYIAGTLPDSAPNENCESPDLPLIGDFFPDPPDDFREGCERFLKFLGDAPGGGEIFGPAGPTAQPPTTSFFRNSNLTQYGGKHDVSLVGSTGSENTGQASGVAGLLQSYGRERFGGQEVFPKSLSGNEVRQLLTMSAEDVRPANTGQIGQADKANAGWDPHFGYGRVNVAGAMARIAAGRIPPEAQIDSPDWFAPINLARVPDAGVEVKGRVAAPHSSAGVGTWELEYACGQDALDADFKPVPEASGSGPRDGVLGRLSKALLKDLADNCDGSVSNDAGSPAGRVGDPWPADPYPDPDPQRHAFQIRLTVHESGDAANIGRYRKTLHAYNDDGVLAGFPKAIGPNESAADYVTGGGGEASVRMADLNGDNALELILPTTSGEVHVLRPDGRPLQSFNDGEPVRTKLYAHADAHDVAARIADPPRESLRIPAVGDITGDGVPEIVATAGERLYAWTASGARLQGFPQRVDPNLSEPCIAGVPKPCFNASQRFITSDNHIKRGFIGSPALADLDADGRLDVVAAALDAHVYAWDGDGDLLPGFPRKLDHPDSDVTAEIITTPAIADLDGDGRSEVIVATNEALPGDPDFPPPEDPLGGLFGSVSATPVYALKGDGSFAPGWPIKLGNLVSDVLPLVGPGHDAAVLDSDGDGDDEVSVSALTAAAKLVDGNGESIRAYDANAQGTASDPSLRVNLFDYASIGDIAGTGKPQVFKGGGTLNLAANLLAVNQNLPFNHVVQGWDPGTGAAVPGFPVATDDFQLLSQPVIAKVDASGPQRQAIVGTGLYQVHAYGLGGAEPSGWPKFVGGWQQATPTVGDLDDDGKLDVVAVTREGWAFAWGTDAPVCKTGSTTTNEEWWTFHHDEHATADYGHDARPPGKVSDLTAQDGRLAWKASGDDLRCGRAASYVIRHSARPITDANFAQAEDVDGEPAPAEPGQEQSFELPSEAGRYVGVRAVDDQGNVSRVAVVDRTPDDGAGGGDGGDAGGTGGGTGGGGSTGAPGTGGDGAQLPPGHGLPGADGGLEIATGGLVLRRGRVAVRLVCRSARPCVGTLKIDVSRPHASRKRRVRLGSRRFRIRPGARLTLRVKIRRRGRALVRRRGRVRVPVTATGRGRLLARRGATLRARY